MNEIEAKRKELESDMNDERKSYGSRSIFKDRLTWFNIGVEMVRKEILDKLWNFYHSQFRTSEEHAFVIQFIQSLEEKKK